MSTSLHAVCTVVSGIVDSVILIFNNDDRKTRVSESSQNSLTKKLIFGQFEVIFLNV